MCIQLYIYIYRERERGRERTLPIRWRASALYSIRPISLLRLSPTNIPTKIAETSTKIIPTSGAETPKNESLSAEVYAQFSC